MEITCPKCNASLSSDDGIPVGTNVSCPACNSVFAVGDTSPEPPPAQNHAPHAPVMKPVAKYNESKEPKKSDTERFLRVVAYIFLIPALFGPVAFIGGCIVKDDSIISIGLCVGLSSALSSLLLHALCNHLRYQREQIALLRKIAEK